MSDEEVWQVRVGETVYQANFATLQEWVATGRVPPHTQVRKGELLASLDCRKASAASRAVAMQTRAIEARQKAISGEAQRVKTLLAGGFVSENEVEQKQAQSAAEQAQLMSLQSQLTSKALEADDCSLRAPFDGEVSERSAGTAAWSITIMPGPSNSASSSDWTISTPTRSPIASAMRSASRRSTESR